MFANNRHDQKLHANLSPWSQSVEFLLATPDAVAEINWKKVEHDPGCVPVPSFSLDFRQAQSLMDQLWQCGLRPSEGTGSAGALAATQKHLEDMRTLVFKK